MTTWTPVNKNTTAWGTPDKNITTWSAPTKSSLVTWATITTTYASETRTWDALGETNWTAPTRN